MKIYALLGLGAVLLWGCQKADDVLVSCEPFGPASAAKAYQDFRLRNSAPQQTFAFDLASPRPMTTAAGAVIRLPANAFLLPGGAPATGPAELRMRELYTSADFILADMPTGDLNVNGGVPTQLMSGGEFKLQVWQGNTRLTMRSDSISISSGGVGPLLITSLPPPTTDSVRFVGMTTWSLALPAATWRDQRTPVAFGPSQAIPASPPQGVFTTRIYLDSLSWWNIDQLWHANPASRSTAEFSFDNDTLVTGLTRGWLKPAGINAVFPSFLSAAIGPLSPTGRLVLPGVPQGSRLTAAVLQVRADGLYFGSETAVIQPGTVPHVALQKLSEAEVVRRIRAL